MTTTKQPALFDTLKTAMRGPVIQPADHGYEAARAGVISHLSRRPGPTTGNLLADSLG